MCWEMDVGALCHPSTPVAHSFKFWSKGIITPAVKKNPTNQGTNALAMENDLFPLPSLQDKQ